MKKMNNCKKVMALVMIVGTLLCTACGMFVYGKETNEADRNQAIAEFYAEHEFNYENMTVEVIEVNVEVSEHWGSEGTISCLIYENGNLKRSCTFNKSWVEGMMEREDG